MTFPRNPSRQVFTPRERTLMLVMDVANKHGVEPLAIFTRKRSYDIALARHEVCWRLYRAGKSTPQIGRFLRRDHSTVLYAIRRMEALHGAA